jgi:hypothetical protein
MPQAPQVQPATQIAPPAPATGEAPVELPQEVRLMLDLYSESNHLVLLCMEIDEKDIERKPVLGELREQCKIVGRLVRDLDRIIRRRAEEIRRQRTQPQVPQPPFVQAQ